MTQESIARATPAEVHVLGKYLVLAALGRGGMAEVYLALLRGPNGFSKLVVLKLLRSHLAEDENFLRMFLSEARLTARLNHANIVQTHEIGVEGGRHCIVMEYLEGRTLSELGSAKSSQPISLNLGVRVLAETLAALHYAHELCDVDGRPLGIVHRDVSPHNLMVTFDGQVKLLDFGIAKAVDDGARTKTGVFKGKLRYTAPERFAGIESDRRADIFSVGVMLWQLLTRRHLWEGMNDLAVMQRLANRAPIPTPRSLVPDVSPRLEEICLKALVTSPDDRFQTAAEMQDALEDYLAADSMGTTNRALGRFMGEVFGEARQAFQRTVDEQIRATASLPFESDPALWAERAMEGYPGTAGGHESLSSLPVRASMSRVRADTGNVALRAAAVETVDVLLAEALSPRPRRRWLLAPAAVVLVVAGVLARGTWAPPARDVPPQTPAPVATSSAILAPSTPTTAVPPAPVEPGPPVADAAPQRAVHTPAPAGNTARAAGPSRFSTRPSPAVSSPAPASAAAAKRVVDCASPYFIDDQGIEKIRTECL